ncbi:hypothetical protein DY467_25110, partial [Rhodopseudomonas sp. BR0G17]|nr:hypothetical protein [Rhodopseudomonas sp. BR0G17]
GAARNRALLRAVRRRGHKLVPEPRVPDPPSRRPLRLSAANLSRLSRRNPPLRQRSHRRHLRRRRWRGRR